MNLKYRVIRQPVTKEEKLQRATMYMKDTGIKVNVEDFLNKEVYDEYVEMKCLNCGHEEIMNFDILQELMEMYATDYPEESCPKCDHGMVPKDLYNEFKIIFKE